MKLRLLFLFLSVAYYCSAQNKIHFNEVSLETALSIAKDKNKNVFIDTYASYCIPCKKLEKEFAHPAVAQFYNEHFVNIRVNMEKEKSKEYELEYQVVFLPTIIYVTPEGRVLTKLDKLITANELLSIGKLFSNPPNSAPLASTSTTPAPPPASRPVATAPIRNPVIPSSPAPKTKPTIKTEPTLAAAPAKSATTTTQPSAPLTKPAVREKKTVPMVSDDEGGKILYVMGQDSDDLPPAILKEEAYFRMQLMDGSHHAAAKKYLATQKDWQTEENLKFIHDFLHNTRSEEFEFLIANKAAFEAVIGEDRISQTMTILVNKELERGFPRPDLARAKKLYGYLSPADADIKAACYEMNTLYEAEKTKEFLAYAKPYMSEADLPAELLYRYSSTAVLNSKSKKTIKNCLKIAERAATIDADNAEYLYNCARLSALVKDKKKATAYLAQAQAKANGDADLTQKISGLQATLEQL